MADGPLMVRTLTDGDQTAEQVAGWVGGFMAGATATLDIALYDFALSPGVIEPVAAALAAATARGVRSGWRTTSNIERPSRFLRRASWSPGARGAPGPPARHPGCPGPDAPQSLWCATGAPCGPVR